LSAKQNIERQDKCNSEHPSLPLVMIQYCCLVHYCPGYVSVVELPPYTYEQFYEITLRLLDIDHEIARIISDAVWNRSRDVRDCVRISKFARSEEGVKFLVENFISCGNGIQR
jgi:hypothetical protein